MFSCTLVVVSVCVCGKNNFLEWDMDEWTEGWGSGLGIRRGKSEHSIAWHGLELPPLLKCMYVTSNCCGCDGGWMVVMVGCGGG